MGIPATRGVGPGGPGGPGPTPRAIRRERVSSTSDIVPYVRWNR